MLIEPDDLTFSQRLGLVADLRHDHVVLLVPLDAWSRRDHLCRGSLCFLAQRARDGQHNAEPLGAPSHDQPDNVRLDRLLLLRLLDHPVWPEPGSSQDQRLAALWTRLGQDGPLHARALLVRCSLLGAFEGGLNAADSPVSLTFSGEPGQLQHADHYVAYAPTPRLLDLFVNGSVNPRHRIRFGLLRHDESPVYSRDGGITACVSMLDIRGRRTAMFGKTRLGKSNVVKLLVQGMLDVTAQRQDVGQLIFDVNGEYANSNPQDGAANIGAVYADRCTLYYLSERKLEGANARLLRFNFHERPEDAMVTLHELLPAEVADTDYVRPLLTCRLPTLTSTSEESPELSQRRLRKLMIYWTVLHHAGFEHDEARLTRLLTDLGYTHPFNPGFHQPLRMAAYQAVNGTAAPSLPKTFLEMVTEVALMLRFILSYPNDPSLRKQGAFIFDSDEEIMASFLYPQAGAGPYVLRHAVPFHSPRVNNFITEILATIDRGGTVIIDLGSANERIIRYFAKTLSIAVFLQQEGKFVRNEMHGRYVQIYFEEAHMIFPPNAGNVIDVYSRFAKEGAKFNIGIVYSTQSPSTVNHDLLAQTENFFIGHLSSEQEARILSTVQYAFKGLEEDIMRTRTPGFMRALTASHRFPIPVQANRYDGQSLLI